MCGIISGCLAVKKKAAARALLADTQIVYNAGDTCFLRKLTGPSVRRCGWSSHSAQRPGGKGCGGGCLGLESGPELWLSAGHAHPVHWGYRNHQLSVFEARL